MTENTDRPSRFRNFCRISQIYFAFSKHALTQLFQRKIELRDPQQVLRQKFGNDLEVLDHATDKLVKFGDNYSSTIVKATINIKREGRIEKLNLVAKLLPSSEFVRKEMQFESLMSNEIFLYEEVMPAYQKLGGSDFDITPKFYGGRLTSNPGETPIDDGAVLFLENLKESGYVMGERLNGLTLDQLRIAVPAIAKFHAIGLAMKQKNPEFYLKIKHYVKIFNPPRDFINMFVSKLIKVVKNNRELSNYYERILSLGRVDSNGNYLFFEELDSENPYGCVVHSDLWINNMMFHSNEGEIDGFKIFDFQLYHISSPMTDLMYFLFTSLPREFGDFDVATKLYRESMCNALKQLDCDSSLFEEEAFERRLKEDAKHELYRCLMMSQNIETRSMWDMMRTSANALQRMKGILRIYESKGWFDS